MKLLLAIGCLAVLFANLFSPDKPDDRGWMPVAAPVAVRAEPETRIRYPAKHLPTLVLPDGGSRRVASLLRVDRHLSFGEYRWDVANVPDGPLWIRIDLDRQTLSVFRAGHEIGTTVVIFGADGKPTPLGVFPVLARAETHRSSLYDADMPFMLQLTGDGVAIHASDVRQGAATHGCIGVPPGFAQLLFQQVRIGDKVAIS